MQHRFDDLYTAVYELIDDAKMGRNLVKLQKGSHAAVDPYPAVLEMGAHLYRRRRGMLAFAAHQVAPFQHDVRVDHLTVFDHLYRPRLALREVFERLAVEHRRHSPTLTDDDILARVTQREHELGRYRGGSSGGDDEARAVAAMHFRQAGLRGAAARDVAICCGGAKGAFMALTGAVMCRHENERVHRMSGRMLAPAGYYQSLRVVAPVFGGTIDVAARLDAEHVEAWLTDTVTVAGRIIYVPLVNNVDGQVLTRDRAHEIAQVVLRHNQRSANPVWVLGDDVYAGSYLVDPQRLHPTPIGAVTGDDLGEPDLGVMSDWTLSVVTSSKTFALPTSRVAFAHTTNPDLRAGVEHYRTMLSMGRVPQGDELTAAAAIALTPQLWVDDWNQLYQRRVHWLREQLAAINAEVGAPVYSVTPPQGGWYVALRINPEAVAGTGVRTSVDMLAVLLHYGGHVVDSGIAALPGELSGYELSPAHPDFVLRLSLAVDDAEFDRLTQRLRDLAVLLTGAERDQVVATALRRAAGVAPSIIGRPTSALVGTHRNG